LRQGRKTAVWAAAQLQEVPAAMPYILIRWPELVQESEPVAGATDQVRPVFEAQPSGA
jgi:hypothetical protein